jgi:hypothetical protein
MPSCAATMLIASIQPEDSLKVARTDCLPRRPELVMKVKEPLSSIVFFRAISDLYLCRY